jgi:starvation-inducible DNA-binding protein
MNPTKNDLPLKLRTKMVELLNARLADLLDLQLQTKQAHWNVKGPTFIALHLLFDSINDEIVGFIDSVAERVTALGGIAEGTVASISKNSSLPAYSLKLTKGRDHVDALSSAIAATGKLIRAAIDEADKAGDKGTADLFTGISRTLDQKLWFVESHLQDG